MVSNYSDFTLQRSVGSQGAHRPMPSDTTGSNFANIAIQTKLRVSQPNDAYEQEADRVAEQVTRMSTPSSAGISITKEVNRKCSACGNNKEDEVKNNTLNISRKPATRPSFETREQATTDVNNVLSSRGTLLDNDTKKIMESSFGIDFSRVRIHTDEKAAESANSVNAVAYSVGQDIVFGPDQYSPRTKKGEQLLAHELTHVVQANSATLHPAMPSSSVDSLENESQKIAAAFSPNGVMMPIHGIARNLNVPLRAGEDQPTLGNLPRDLPEPTGRRRFILVKVKDKWYEVSHDGRRRTASGKYDFVVMNGSIYAVKASSKFGHTEAALGGRVTWAGGIQFTKNGVLKEWNNASGHYVPAGTLAVKEIRRGEIVEKVGLVHPDLPGDKYTALKFPPGSQKQLPVAQPKPGEVAVPPRGEVKKSGKTRRVYSGETVSGEINIPSAGSTTVTETKGDVPPGSSPVRSKPGTSKTTSTRAKVGAVGEAAAQALNTGGNMAVDYFSKMRYEEQYAVHKPHWEAYQKSNPQMGILLILKYNKGVDSGQGPYAAPGFISMTWEAGLSEDRAKAAWKSRPSYERSNYTYDFQYIQALEPEGVAPLNWQKVAIGKFVNQRDFNLVRIGYKQRSMLGFGGREFEINGQYDIKSSAKSSSKYNFEFMILRIPPKIPVIDTRGGKSTLDVTTREYPVMGGTVPVIMIDDEPIIAAVGANADTVGFFNWKINAQVRDLNHSLRLIEDIYNVRWLRPKDVQIVRSLREFMVVPSSD
jgi:hypothetical protein